MPKTETVAGSAGLIAQQMAQATAETQAANNLKNRKVTSEKDVEKAASGFEALLLHEMMKAMWATVENTNALGEKSNEGEIYRDMLNQAISDSVADGKGIGVKDFLRKELSRHGNASKEESKPDFAESLRRDESDFVNPLRRG